MPVADGLLPRGMLAHHRNRKIHFRQPLTFFRDHKFCFEVSIRKLSEPDNLQCTCGFYCSKIVAVCGNESTGMLFGCSCREGVPETQVVVDFPAPNSLDELRV